ncbi:MAG: hypothetical protein KatS3mg076_0284 [Candidatus Binatia bacterium]|nr:MAG: hypothetical protein KatS3mg076_0284 [Candidatus Binatia bacterium]
MSLAFAFRLLVAVACAAPAGARAQGGGEDGWQLPAPRDRIVESLSEVAARFGPDAVLLQAYLLNEALRSGSILETTVSAPDIDERSGRKYLALTLDSGLVFDDAKTDADERVRLVWVHVVERALKRQKTFRVPAEGIAVRVRYHHRRYRDEDELRRSLPTEGRGKLESVSFYLGLDDLHGFLADRLSAQQLLDRSEVRLNGSPYRVRLRAPAGPEPPAPPG